MPAFKIPPISTLAGSNLLNYIKVLRSGCIHWKYYHKIILTGVIILIATPFHWWEELVFRRKINQLKPMQDPVFIIGHWRSGTTLLHNLLCQDPDAAYVSTYQSLFPNNLASKWLFKTFMQISMPNKRPSDNVALNINYPQEEEFAFGNCQPNAYYNFFYFPEQYQHYYKKAVSLQDLSPKVLLRWNKQYSKLLKKAVLNTKGNRLFVKNPVNTARIEQLLSLYPEAKFIYMYRNPITVFLSTQRFFKSLFPTLNLQDCNKTLIDRLIFDVFDKLMTDYELQKDKVPAGNLLEIKFESFEEQPLSFLETIYTNVLKADFESVKPYFVKHLNSISNYRKNQYIISQAEKRILKKHLAKFLQRGNYKLPDASIEQDLK